MNLRAWLQIGRAQTWPADWLLVLVPFLHGRLDLLQAMVLSILMWFSHIGSFGHNSLLDACTKPSIDSPHSYDQLDQSKSHHPLIRGTISFHAAKNVILWGLGLLALAFVFFTLLVAENLSLSLTALFLYWVWGVLYNEGLSKESPFGFLSISLCFTSLAAFGWFLSHRALSTLGLVYVLYSFFTILFQISYSGFIKELRIKERSNILTRMGATLDATSKGEMVFKPGLAGIYGIAVKMINLALGLFLVRDVPRMIWWMFMTLMATRYLLKLVMPRKYVRGKELFNMGIEEILTIYLPIPLVLDWTPSCFLMVLGVIYYFSLNKLLWKTSFPRV